MRWVFDFISPYAYLQSTQLQRLEQIEPLACVPVLFAGLLNHWGHTGPAELAPKRQWTFEHVTWLAHRDHIDLRLPPHHPFNPLPLLRLSAVLDNELTAVQRIFRWVWAEGHAPDQTEAFADLCAEFNIAQERLADPKIKQAIRANTDQAIADGVFGVPTVQFDQRLFWGFEATDMVLACAQRDVDPAAFPADRIDAAANLNEGASQRRSMPAAPPASTSIEPRVPYLPADLSEPSEVVDAVRARRGGELLELDRMLLHSPPLTAGWNVFLGAVRTRLSLDRKIGEMVICTVAVLNGAVFEFGQHAPLFLAAGGSQAQCDALTKPVEAAQNSGLFTEAERAALLLCVQMTRFVTVDDEVVAESRRHFGDQATVELIATIGAYNMVSRFLVALNVHDQPKSN